MRKNSVKNTRINGEVLKELSQIIREDIKDPRISPWTSVVSVEVAPDLKTCKAWISVLGSKEDSINTGKGLKSAEGFVRRELAHRLNLRNTPEITFIMDQSIEYGVNMSHMIDEVIAHDENSARNRGELPEEDSAEDFEEDFEEGSKEESEENFEDEE